MFFAEEAGGEFLHEVFENEENHEAGGDDDGHDDEVLGGEEHEFKEVADEGDGESSSHDADDGEEEAGTERI